VFKCSEGSALRCPRNYTEMSRVQDPIIWREQIEGNCENEFGVPSGLVECAGDSFWMLGRFIVDVTKVLSL